MQISAASNCAQKRRINVQRQTCVVSIVLAVGPKVETGLWYGRLEGRGGEFTRERRRAVSRAAQRHCSIAWTRMSGEQDVERLWRCKMMRVFMRDMTEDKEHGSRCSRESTWKAGGKAERQVRKWVSKVASVLGAIVEVLRVFMSCEMLRTT